MPFEKFEDAEAIDSDRRNAIARSIRIISVEELKKLGEEMFDSPDGPWRETFFQFIAEHPGPLFTTRLQGRASFLFTPATETKACGICPGAAWEHCWREAVD